MEVSIIIPVKNEEKNIATVLKNLQKKIKISFEVLIIYDSEHDPTKTAAEKYIKEKKLKNIYVSKNNKGNKKGVVNAIKTGIAHARGKAVVITMADLSDDMKQIDQMYNLIKKGFDIVAASRYMKQGKKTGGPFLKTMLSKTAGLSLFYFFNVPTHDATNAYKMYRKSLFRTIKIESTGGFEYSLEIVIKAHKSGFKITEIPTQWKDREQGKSNFKLYKWLPKYIMIYALIFKSIKEK
jgi:dolichol-phosphate mannosyltransferase